MLASNEVACLPAYASTAPDISCIFLPVASRVRSATRAGDSNSSDQRMPNEGPPRQARYPLR